MVISFYKEFGIRTICFGSRFFISYNPTPDMQTLLQQLALEPSNRLSFPAEIQQHKIKKQKVNSNKQITQTVYFLPIKTSPNSVS